MILAGYLINQINEKEIEVTSIMNTNPNGSIPDILKEKIATKQGNFLRLIKKHLESHWLNMFR